jgi:hypothetical protein
MILFVAVVAVLAFFAQWYILSHSLRALFYDNHPSRNVVEPGESFDALCELRNEKWLPELFLQVSMQVPKEAGVPLNRVNKSFYMMPYQKLVSPIPLTLPRRGRFIFRGATVMGGDFFGIDARQKQYDTLCEVVVLPERVSVPGLDRILSGFLGELSVNRFIMPDPVLAIGVREYTGREPMKDISWTHSARAGQLTVKRYDHTVELTVTVVLNLETPKTTPPDTKERCFSFSRRVCEELERRGIPYGFRTNAVAVGAVGMWHKINDGLGPLHLSAILEGLGRGTYETGESFASLAEKALRKSEQGRAFVVITPAKMPEHKPVIQRLHARSGIRVLVINADEI